MNEPLKGVLGFLLGPLDLYQQFHSGGQQFSNRGDFPIVFIYAGCD
jgi:hypothetical protein